MSNNDIGTTIEAVLALPATFDATGFAALTFVKINGLVSIGEMGDDHASIPVPDLETGRSKTMKGELTGTTSPLVFREIKNDAGQSLAKTITASRDECSFKITEPNGDVYYLAGVAMSYKRSERSVSSYAGFSFQITNNYDLVEVAA